MTKGLRPRIVTVHRWLGLAAAAFWLIQAITGTLIVFHWEMRDAMISQIAPPTDLIAIQQRMDSLAPPGSTAAIGSVWTTAGFPDRYDIYFTDSQGESRSARIAGDGSVLRGPDAPSGGVLDTLVGLHHNLLAGAAGDWIVGISGLLLATNLIAGLISAWPRRGKWRVALKPIVRGNGIARLYSWHRAAGLWLIVPAMLIALTGTMLKFPDALDKAAGATRPTLPTIAATGKPVGFARAAGAALNALPGSTLTSVAFPESGDATYVVRVTTPQEMLRAYGASFVLVDANDGSLRGSFPIVEASFGTRFVNAIVPIHTGRVGGPVARMLVLVTGVGITVMIILGLWLWTRRRKTGARA
ncbi:PepSY-associated TM helix domain-containing protein [Sphingomonas sp. SRS2]|uniref:PepSY-associated TM helix domain-containing protein n=1 Tax=Sphingomonas sp. SRS2 TaxID=133190 RepID=UPI000A7147BF|nr:PepSY-associated TM helix domain-containing protein [Sphingomonas sp. SRS2]